MASSKPLASADATCCRARAHADSHAAAITSAGLIARRAHALIEHASFYGRTSSDFPCRNHAEDRSLPDVGIRITASLSHVLCACAKPKDRMQREGRQSLHSK